MQCGNILRRKPRHLCKKLLRETHPLNVRKLDLRRIIVYVAIFSLLIYYVLAWINMLADPDQRTGSDFIGFYNFGRITQTKGVPAIYSIDEQKRLEEEVVGHPVTPIFYTHMPFIAPLAAILVKGDYIGS